MAISDLTTNSLTGSGAFDVLMAVASKHLEQEFNKNRITGKDYATVYLGSLTAVLQNAIAFLTIDHQKAKIAAETAKIAAETAKIAAETDLIDKNILKLDAEIALLNKGLAKSDAEIALLLEKANTEREQQDNMISQQALYAAQTKGFARDAEQKLAKIMVDSWSVRRTTDDATMTPSSLTDSAISSMISRAIGNLDD